MQETILERIRSVGIVPVVVLEEEKDALPLAKALLDGGLGCAEVTFRTACAEQCIRIIHEQYPEILLGAGTVLTIAQVDRAIAAGAQFIVSPGFDAEIVDYCISKNILIIPGCITPSELAQAAKRGLGTVKFFPAEQFGGLGTIKALAAPYVGMQFMPTGGVNAENVREYLGYERIAACGGSWMVKGTLVKKGDFKKITELTREAAKIVKEVR